ncbi:MAG: endonuclease [Lentisphaeraceae bacterium]|nr:endonuclease [Lentisphaeraceae bacterium]
MGKAMKEFDQILEKIFSDNKYSRSEKNALEHVIETKNFNERELALLRSQLFDSVREHFTKKEDRSIISCLENILKTLLPKPAPHTASAVETFFSPGNDCLKAIRTQIRQARSSIDICIFTISDDRISKEIISAWERGIKVRIVSDNDKQYDRGSDIKRLQQEGIPVVTDLTDNHMHHKFAIFDKCIVLCGSYNWTRSAAIYNNEDILVLDNPTSVAAFRGEFEKLWKEFN